MSTQKTTFPRRRVLQGSGIILSQAAISIPSISYASARPTLDYGVQSGDVGQHNAVVWSRASKPSKMWVEVSTTADFSNSRIVPGPNALPENDFTGKVMLSDLPAGQQHYFRVFFQDFDNARAMSKPSQGRFKTAPSEKSDIRFAWSGDTAGQGWGINENDGGMRAYDAMRQNQPDFFINSGDCIYADGPISAEVELKDGSIWTNVVTEEVAKVAETQQEFRGRYQYNLMDKNVRLCNASVPVFAQWDDHETVNNWYPGEILEDERYTETNVDLLSARANKAFLEYMPIANSAEEPSRIYREINYGPHLDVFMLDMRSYRGKNSPNTQEKASEDTAFLGQLQIAWLKKALKASKATWKVMGADMPIGLMVRDGDNMENSSNGDGPVLGREHDIAEILKFIKDENITNVVWLTADVHYTAAHYYDPNQAQFQDFLPFWEFVSGPMNAGNFGPNDLDNTFGPKVEYFKAPTEEQGMNTPPSAGMQFFGLVDIAGESGEMTVRLMDMENQELYSKVLTPA